MDFETLPSPSERNPIVDASYLAARRHVIHGLIEVDVTRARAILQEQAAQTGSARSFTAYLVASLAQKPDVYEGQIAIRDYLSLTLSFDHNIVDGAPAARFARDFKALLESAYNLIEN